MGAFDRQDYSALIAKPGEAESIFTDPIEPYVEKKVPKDRSILEAIGDNLAIGTAKYGVLPVAGITQMVGDTLGIENLSTVGKDLGDRTEQYLTEKEQANPSQKFQDISSVGDAGKWAGEQLTQFVPQAAIMAATGGVGAGAGRVAASKLIGRGIATAEGIAGKEAVTAVGEKAAEIAANRGIAEPVAKKLLTESAALNRAGTIGAQVANTANSVGMETATIYQGQKDEKEAGRALLYGTAAGLLDSAIPNYLLQKTGVVRFLPGMGEAGKDAAELAGKTALTGTQRLKDIAKVTGGAIGGEAVQEGVQTVLERIGSRQELQSDEAKQDGFWKVASEKGIRAAVHPEAWNDIVESMAAGGLIGGVMGGGMSVAGHVADSRTQKQELQNPGPPSGEAAQTPAEQVPSFPVPQGVSDSGTSILEDSTPQPSVDVPAGPMSKALAAGGININRGTTGISNMVSDARQQRGGIATLPADTGLAPLPIQSELDQAREWANQQIASGNSIGLMQNRGVSDQQYAATILDRFRKSKEAANDATDILPAMQGNGPLQVDRAGLAVPEVQSEVAGVGSNNIQPGGLTDGLSNMQKEVSGQASQVPAVRDSSVTVKQPAKSRRQLDATKDSLTVAIAKLGGISRADIDKQAGNGKDLAHTLNRIATSEAKSGLFHVISTKGQPLDRMREALVEQGYLPEGATINDLLDRLDSSSRGYRFFSNQVDGTAAESEYDDAAARYQAMLDDMTDGEHEEYSRNQWLDEQSDLLAEAEALIDEYLAGQDNETMTAADWNAVETEFKEALDGEFRSDSSGKEDQGKVQEDASGQTEGIPPVGEGDIAGQDKTDPAAKTVASLRSADVPQAMDTSTPKFINHYLDTIEAALAQKGITVDSYVSALDEKLLPGVQAVQMRLSRNGKTIGFVSRNFYKDRVSIGRLDSTLPAGEKMGVIPALYPAEGKLARDYGLTLGGKFVNVEVTRPAFMKEHPGAVNTGGNTFEVRYNGTKVFNPDLFISNRVQNQSVKDDAEAFYYGPLLNKEYVNATTADNARTGTAAGVDSSTGESTENTAGTGSDAVRPATEDQGPVQPGGSRVSADVSARDGGKISKVAERLPLPKKHRGLGSLGDKGGTAYRDMNDRYDLWDAEVWDRNDFDRLFYSNYYAGWQDLGQPKNEHPQHQQTADEAYAAGLIDGEVKKKKPAAKKKEAAKESPTYGSSNTLVTADRAAEIRAKLKAKFDTQLNSGIDPEILALGTELAIFHIEAGVRKFTDVAAAISDDIGIPLSRLKEYLRGWYNSARDTIEDKGLSIDGMDDSPQVREAHKAMFEEKPAARQRTEQAKSKHRQNLEKMLANAKTEQGKANWKKRLDALKQKEEQAAADQQTVKPIEEEAPQGDEANSKTDVYKDYSDKELSEALGRFQQNARHFKDWMSAGNKMTETMQGRYQFAQERIDTIKAEQTRRTQDSIQQRKESASKEVETTGVLTITKAERKKIMQAVGDVYKDGKAPREIKGIDRNGNEIYGYEYTPDLFVKSDLSGRQIRHYIVLPDGSLAHPDEIVDAVNRGRIKVVDSLSAEATPVVTKASKPATEKQPAKQESTTADVGEELWYNRRNHTGRGIVWNDIKDLNDTLRTKEVTKSKVWPRPDYEQLVSDGLHPFFARIMKNIYDGIGNNPQSTSDEALQEYITIVNRVRDAVVQWMKDTSAQSAFMDSVVDGAKRDVNISKGGPVAMSELMKSSDFTKTFIEKLWPAEMTKPSYGRFSRGSEANKEAHALGGDRALKALQISKPDLVKFMKEIENGWPGKREAWQTQGYSVQPSTTIPIERGYRYASNTPGDNQKQEVWYTRVAGSFPTEAEARKALTDRGAFLLLDKVQRIKGGYETREQAEDAARKLTSREGGKGGRDMRGMNITEAERTGPDRRSVDENISSKRFMDTFGFKGVNFGRQGYINDVERQEYLNHAYDALLDLADMLNIPAKALSLNGELGIAFGAQGRGGSAAAHFVPGYNEINMTKTMGAGTLAHEWGHGLDHYFAVMAGLSKKTEPYLSEHVTYAGPNSGINADNIRPEVVQAFKTIVEVMTRRPMTENEWLMRQNSSIAKSTKNVKSWLDHARRQFEQQTKQNKSERLKEFDALAERIIAGDLGDGYINDPRSRHTAWKPAVNELRLLFKDATGRMLDKDTSNSIQVWGRAESTASEAKQAVPEHLPQTATDFERESRSKDAEKKGRPYWATKVEMFARAFELFINDKLAEQNFRNTFLSDAGIRVDMKNMDDQGTAYPYPRNAERAAINDAFRSLIGALDTKETDKGTALFALNPEGNKQAGVVADFNDSLELLRDNNLSAHYIFNLGKPSKILTDTGVPNLPIHMAQDVVTKVTGMDGKDKHNIPIELLYNLPRHINNPVAVFTSDSQTEAKTLLLQFRHNGEPVMVALHLENKMGNLVVNRIASVYERSEWKYVNWVLKGRLDSIDKLKGQWLLERLRRTIRPETSGSLTPNKILYHVAEPVKSGLREDIDGNNVSFKLADNKSKGMAAEKARAWVSTLPIAKHVNVVQSIEQLPADARAEIEKAGVDPSWVQAMELHGTIHVITDNVPDLRRVKALVVGHELAHAGQTKKIVDFAVDWFKRTKNGKTEQAIAAQRLLQRVAGIYGYDLDNEKQFRLAVQEATAAYAEQAADGKLPQAGLMQRLFMYIKHWLRQNGLISHVSDSELSLAVAEMLRIGEKRLSVGKGGSEGMLAAAWHGSPHSFDKFTTEAIGTGEGAQAYGYGLYFAGNKEVAEYYRNQLSGYLKGWNYSKESQTLGLNNYEEYRGDFHQIADKDKPSVQLAKKLYNMNRAAREEVPDSLRKLFDRFNEVTRGRLYHVELAPAEDEYLLWDKPLNEQSEKVQEALSKTETLADMAKKIDEFVNSVRSASPQAADLVRQMIYGTESDRTGSDQADKNWSRLNDLIPYEKEKEYKLDLNDLHDFAEMLRENGRSGEDIYLRIASDKGEYVSGWPTKIDNEKAASEYLHSLGIRGIKYFDGSSRGKPTVHQAAADRGGKWFVDGKSTPYNSREDAVKAWENDGANYNYVIFNDADVEIQAKFALQDQAISAHAAAIKAPQKVADMTKGLFELIGQSIPERVKANIGKIMSNPWFGSEGKPIRRKVVNLNLERSQNRNGIISDLFQASEGYNGVEGLDNILKNATKEELKQFNELIKYSDRNDIAQVFTRDELYRGKTPFGKVGKTVVEAYKAFYEIMQAANRVRFQQLDELSLLPYKDQEWFADLINLLDRNQERMAGLTGEEVGHFHRLVRSLKRGLSTDQIISGDNPAKVQSTKAVAEAYHDFWKQVDQTDKRNQGNMLSAFRDILGYRGELDKLKNEWGSLRGYAPRNRKDGDWHVSVYTTNLDGERVKVYMHPTLTEAGAKGHVKEVKANLAKFLKSNFEEGAAYEVEYERNTATPSELLAWKGSEVAVEALLNQAFDRAGVTGKMSVEQWQSLKHEVFQQIAKEIMAQGFGRHGISREKSLIEGYDDTDYQTVLKEYISGMSGWLSKMRFAIETTNAAKDISKADPSDKVWVNDYVQDAMKNSTYMDELAATARSVGAVYYLGFKVSSALLNAFQNYTVGQAELYSMMKKSGIKASATVMLAKAQKDVMADWLNRKRGGKGTLNEEEQEVLRKAVREGTAQAQAVRMISGSQEMGFGTGWKKFTELSMTPFQFIEQMMNREPGVLAAYRVFKKTAAGEFDAAAYKQAEEFVNNTHYVMGKENLPEIVRKLGPLGKTAYLFQGYVHNYLHWMYNRGRDGEFGTIARSLGAIAALGGVFALPGADDLDKWIMKWFGVSYKMKFEKFVREQTGKSAPGRMLYDFINHGATSVAGVDMSRALAVNIPFVSDPDKTFGERMGGAWGGLLKKPGMALSAAQKGDYLRAIENMMPEFAANPMRAMRQYGQGATTLSGKPIFDESGRQVKYSESDVAKKMLGFNPLEISEKTELKGHERDLNAYWKSQRDDILANVRRAKTANDMKAVTREVMEFNRELRQSQAFGLVPIIKAESLQKARTFKPQKKTLLWERNQLD